MTEKESLEHIRRITDENISHIVRNDENIKGTAKIVSRNDGKFDIEVYNGSDTKPRKIESISKEKLIALIEKQM